MARTRPRSWESIRAEKPLDEAQVARWRWLEEAQDRIASARRRSGATSAEVTAAHARAEAVDSAAGEDDVLSELTRFTEALGGCVEVSAVFGEERISLAPLTQTEGGGGH